MTQVVNRFNVDNSTDAVTLLITQTLRWVKGSELKKAVLFITDHSALAKEIESRLLSKQLDVHTITLEKLNEMSRDDCQPFACVTAGFFDSKQLTTLGLALARHSFLGEVPFEFSILPESAYATLIKHDWQKNASFISPLLLSDADYFAIYESSLAHFEKKCQIRDYLDLCQLLQTTLERQIEGDIAEFGSFKGHSGYLIAQVLRKLNSDKKLYMFDMFEEFPEEIVGLDAFWNKTHQVDYEEVKSKFSALNNVTLVKGDFTKTFSKSSINKLCLVYIDCDSYRGTKYLLNEIFTNHLSDNGVMILEDYGHGPLLGNRVAFHEFFDGRKDSFRFFSQFSGFQIIVKLGA